MPQITIDIDKETLTGLILRKSDEAIRILLELIFNALLNLEAAEQVGADPYERTDGRRTYRNGYRVRNYTTRVGTLELRIPKLRNGTFSTELFERYQRSEQALTLSLMEMVVEGVSTRRVERITEVLCGKTFSKSTVSRLCAQLAVAVDEFRNRPLEGAYPFVIVDAMYVKAREGSRVKSKGFLIAIGVNQEGYREVLGFEAGDGESHESWKSFFSSLKERGLRGVEFVVSDQHQGLRRAIAEEFVNATWQRCQTHFSRNVLDKTPKREQPEVKHLLKDMYNSLNLEEARERKARLMDLLERRAPKAADVLDQGFDDAMAILSLPLDYRKRLRTSNSIERVNQELRRRERVIRIFPNERSIVNLLGSLLMEMHDEWLGGQRYIDTSSYHGDSHTALAVNKDAVIA